MKSAYEIYTYMYTCPKRFNGATLRIPIEYRSAHEAIYAATRRQVVQEVVRPNDSPRGASCLELSSCGRYSRFARGSSPGSQRAAACRVPAFYGWNARNRLISRRGGLKKGRRKKMDERTNERTKGSGGSCYAAE